MMIWRALEARCDLLGLELTPLVWLAVDLVVLLAVSGFAARRLEEGSEWGPPRRLLACGLVALSCVVLPATALGAAGWLTHRALLAVHAALLLTALAWARSRGARSPLREVAAGAVSTLRAALAPLYELFSRPAWARARVAESTLVAAIALVLGFYLVLALFTLPLNYDSNTYRLSRLAYWLQEASIHHFPTNDDRQNFVGQNAELVMLWLVSFFPRGYPLVALVQYLGGLLCCLAVHEICRQLGLSRSWRLAAVLTLLGVPTAATQFFTSQTDLFTAGCLAAGLSFLLPALRGRRAGEWALVGVGAGLALGAKGTVLYWAPGLLLLLFAWAWAERASPRGLLRGAALVAAVGVPFALFNFTQNQRDFGQPFAAPYELKTVHHAQDAQVDRTLLDLGRLVWQQLEPGSNRFVPGALRVPASDALLTLLAANDPRSFELLQAERWIAPGLSEDHASFGLLTSLAAVAGAGLALARARRERGGQAFRIGAIAVSTAAFALGFCWIGTVNAHAMRYFCLVVPFVSILATYALAGLPRGAARLLASLFLAHQLATALAVGLESRHHGWRALLDPATATWFPHWQDARELADRLGPESREVGIALSKNSWLAPYFRGAVARRIEMVPAAELRSAASLGELLSRRRLDALILDPAMAGGLSSDDVQIDPAPRVLRSRPIAVRPLAGGERPRPAIVGAYGFTYGGWSGTRAALTLRGWSAAAFELELSNPTPLRRTLAAKSGKGELRVEIAARSASRLELAVGERDTVGLEVSPPFRPPSRAGASDEGELGLLVAPPRLAFDDGLYADGWTAPAATLNLVNWISGRLELPVENPTRFAREVELRGRWETVRLSLAPGERATLAITVLPIDTVELSVAPAFVPASADPRSTDSRALGLLLDANRSAPSRAERLR